MRHSSVFRFLRPAESAGPPASAAPVPCPLPQATASARGTPALLGSQQSARSCLNSAVAAGSTANGCEGDRTKAEAKEDAETEATVARRTQLLDEDGDLIVKRRRAGSGHDGAVLRGGIVIHHALATSLNQVGKQVGGAEGLAIRCSRAVLCWELRTPEGPVVHSSSSLNLMHVLHEPLVYSCRTRTWLAC